MDGYEKRSVTSPADTSVTIPEEEFFVTMNQRVGRRKNTNMFMMVLSAMYAKLIVVMGIAFPLSPIISPHTPNTVYQGFYLYLYLGSIVFLIYAFTVHATFPETIRNFFENFSFSKFSPKVQNNNNADNNSDKVSIGYAIDSRNYGSFYLRVGAVAFGIGNMIYSGLEFIKQLEINPECRNIIQLLDPCAHLVFTFLQLYFIFINSRMSFHHHESVGHMGLMHLMATNLCVWLHSVVEETQHEIFHSSEIMHGVKIHVSNNMSFGQEGDYVDDDYGELPPIVQPYPYPIPHQPMRTKRAINMDPNSACQSTDVFSQLLQDISPFLFPCVIEYSLICAAICYIMWKHAGQKRIRHPSDSVMDIPFRKHQYSVDCSHAITGLFTGIMVLVLSIISVIIFFVLVNKEEHRIMAIQVAYVSELILFILNTFAVIVAMVKIKHFRRTRNRSNVELDNILLIMGQMGVYMLSIFSMIAGHLAAHLGVLNTFVLMSSFGRLVQATLQTMFILDASSRNACTEEQERRKPGREMVTFLLVCNFAMWVITTLETGRMDSSVIQLGYFGFWGWTLIARISTPLSIFYRFHSTVCLCDIWKKLYKLKGENL